MSSAHNRTVVDFFRKDYRRWSRVYAEDYEDRFFGYEMLSRKRICLQLIDDSLRSGPLRVLDCGCGPGGVVFGLEGRAGCLTAVDINLDYLQVGRREGTGAVKLVNADIENLPFGNETFDLVCCTGVLSYLEQDDRALREIHRVAKPGAGIIISLPNYLVLSNLLDPYYALLWLPKKIVRRRSAVQGRERAFSSAMIRRYHWPALKKLYAQHGFVLRQNHNVGFGPLRCFRKELLPTNWSIGLSDWLAVVSDNRLGRFLTCFANHWVTCLQRA
jgi:ubiquinone/menaquinone biosynthesis C-methylase UbiE